MQYSIPTFGIPSFGLPSFGLPESPSESSGEGPSLPNETIIEFEFYIYGVNSSVTPELYKQISDQYGTVYQQLQQSLSNIGAAVSHVATLDNPDAKIDLLQQLRNNQREFSQNKMISNLYPAVSKINYHVISRNGKENINEWLSEKEIKVIRDWANLCRETGTIIDEENIEV